MHLSLSHILLLSIPVFTSVFGSDCQVSKWSSWSQCFGNCETALSVRNRDVLVPPLPSLGRKVTYSPCPYLYETKSCKPDFCNQIQDEVPDMPTPGPFPMESREIEKYQITHEDNTVSEQEIKEKRPIKAKTWTSRLEKKSFGTKTINAETLDQIANTESHSETLIKLTTTTPTYTTVSVVPKQNYYINSLTLELPLKPQITPEVERKLKDRFHIDKIKYRSFETTTIEPELNEVFRHLERAAELNLPVDEKQIREALKKNKKLVKALVEAYRSRKSNRPISSSTTSTTEVPTTATAHTSDASTEKVASTAAPPNYWPRHGYIPNTKKHATEITSKLYMTKEIVQVLHEDPLKKEKHEPSEECLENSRCCKVMRHTCGNYSQPQVVKRYYRPKGSPNCVAYNYPRCSQATEMEEQPIQFLQNCQDLCFSTSEKRISPLYILGQDY